jgi:hypothetical protein
MVASKKWEHRKLKEREHREKMTVTSKITSKTGISKIMPQNRSCYWELKLVTLEYLFHCEIKIFKNTFGSQSFCLKAFEFNPYQVYLMISLI